jgi:hypothetical protein
MKRDTRTAYRRRAADTERMVDQAVAEVKADRAARMQKSKDRATEQRARFAIQPAIDPTLLTAGMWVLNRRADAGQVVRVNGKTVTVSYMDLEFRWPLDTIIAAKEATA